MRRDNGALKAPSSHPIRGRAQDLSTDVLSSVRMCLPTVPRQSASDGERGDKRSPLPVGMAIRTVADPGLHDRGWHEGGGEGGRGRVRVPAWLIKNLGCLIDCLTPIRFAHMVRDS